MYETCSFARGSWNLDGDNITIVLYPDERDENPRYMTQEIKLTIIDHNNLILEYLSDGRRIELVRATFPFLPDFD